ncbi:uncharacterized protein LOC128388265 [Panonychus citri]|uniref:uncharacterized protein LOC128388265 n=1 Tax=Panonychus citri TaxID=50023 RepID=UPI002307357B|nr:uncharacterized protein LOC128388265 [Panonychus citri]
MEEEQWTFLDTKVTIVNRKKSYQIPKQKLSSIPYFVKLFSDSNCDTTKIELDLDGNSFDNIVDFIQYNRLSLSMESALKMMELANYLGMDEIQQKYHDFFRSHFNIGILRVLIDIDNFYDEHNLPRMFDEEKLNSFIGKYFLPISNTRAFLKFSVSLLERILKLKLVVSYEYQIVEAIDRWIIFNEKDRKQHLPRLIKFVNLCHLKNSELEIVSAKLKNSVIDIQRLLRMNSFHTCHPEFCQPDREKNPHYNKSLIAIFELDEDTIEIRCLSKSNLLTTYDIFTQDETISSSLIEADHIVDIIYDSGRKGIRVDWNTKKFKYLKMFGDDNSYYGQVHKYITHDICNTNNSAIIKNSKIRIKCEPPLLNLQRVESISLGDHLRGIFDVKEPSRCSRNSSRHSNRETGPMSQEMNTRQAPAKAVDKSYLFIPRLDYRRLSSCTFQGLTETRSCLHPNGHSNPVMYILTQHDFSFYFDRQFESKTLDYTFLKSFIGSDSLDHIELISHNNSILICNKETKTIYSYIGATDDWQIISKIESYEKMITIASINLPIDSE